MLVLLFGLRYFLLKYLLQGVISVEACIEIFWSLTSFLPTEIYLIFVNIFNENHWFPLLTALVDQPFPITYFILPVIVMPDLALTYQKSLKDASEVMVILFPEKWAPNKCSCSQQPLQGKSRVLLCISHLLISVFQSDIGVFSVQNFLLPLPPQIISS